MKRLALPLVVLMLAGCGAQGVVAPTQRAAGAAGASSLVGDIAKKLAPIAARRGVQAALVLALKKDDKTAAELASAPADASPESREDAAEKRMKALQRALFAADIALGRLDGVEAVVTAVKAAKATDKAEAQAFTVLRSAADRTDAYGHWADALHDGLSAAVSAF
jgi:hypothetical protein